MAVLHDFECTKCGNISEQFCDRNKKKSSCPECGKTAKKIISLGKVYTANEDAPWIKSVLEVVDKDSKKPHVQNFIKNPTRSNYKAWMKGEGLRPVDSTVKGGPPVYQKPERSEYERQQMTKEIFERHRARKSISI